MRWCMKLCKACWRLPWYCRHTVMIHDTVMTLSCACVCCFVMPAPPLNMRAGGWFDCNLPWPVDWSEVDTFGKTGTDADFGLSPRPWPESTGRKSFDQQQVETSSVGSETITLISRCLWRLRQLGKHKLDQTAGLQLWKWKLSMPEISAINHAGQIIHESSW